MPPTAIYQNERVDGAEVIYSIHLVSTSASILNQIPTEVREVRDTLANLSIATGANSVQLNLPDEYMTDGFASGLSVESASGSAVNYTVNGNLLTIISDTPGLQELILRGVTNSGQAVVERFTLEVDDPIAEPCSDNCSGEDIPNSPPELDSPQPGAGGSSVCFFCVKWWQHEGAADEYFQFQNPTRISDSGSADPNNPGTNFNTFIGTGWRVVDFKGARGLGYVCWEPITWLTVGAVFWWKGPDVDCSSSANGREEVTYSWSMAQTDARNLVIQHTPFTLMEENGTATFPPENLIRRNTGFSPSDF